jgi:hypothetical protein
MQVVLGPWNYLNERPGRKSRGVLIDSFNAWIGLPEDKLNAIKEVVDGFHTASLLYVSMYQIVSWTVI